MPSPAQSSHDIPVAHTPLGGWSGALPALVLARCTDTLVDGAPDLRGTWEIVEVSVDGRVVADHPALGHTQ
ncbi:MAG TPA: hypothetical protein VGU73_03850, partial [Acidimicrobiia bacterium]|nr:hypothetical protein [Acidimicrobiia bacterium]